MAEGTNPPTLTAVVIDASAIVSFIATDESAPPVIETHFQNILHHKTIAYAPNLLLYEVLNAFRSMALSKRLSHRLLQDMTKLALSFPTHYQDTDFKRAIDLSLTHQLSLYDAAYLELSLRLKAPLLTLDAHLASLA